ncbi:hypothetical protein RhiJN_02278 [Ceratobasidium sp. AG-Ba]|nr:hypothetical protein RhiJN_02278 [Ceratobasidium sp. AG-Ba]QRW03210.1 hypothetical protein RhiLY_02209 [Ceratobasidium sp. AG-Ba]
MISKFLFPANSSGPALIRLLMVSSVVATVSLALNLVSFGYYSLFIIPSAWVVTAAHHVTMLCVLPKRRTEGTQELSQGMPRFLKHAGNIWGLHYSGLLWWAGAAMTLTSAILDYYYESSGSGSVPAVGLASGAFAIVEGGLLIAMSIISWKSLSREGYCGPRDEVSLKAKSATSLV